ncbi:hypothetical protein BASA81_002136 [Batrachochytrium salamandrivorans]|nr:hypothetical protein BASA81_001965 [Batrachochytrium salamandrivorans]KAH9259714.1 hypothetical protein BASA81_002136 [Batrachochytrium salamandrivorans]
MSSSPAIAAVESISAMHWKTMDPFLFCAHHEDHYPASASSGPNHPDMGVDRSLLAGRNIGSDFSNKDGFSMYHGSSVPGFPNHPHFGFETVTIVTQGLVDHSDSMGNAARFGKGDVQWLTAGNGIQHSEMFPLVRSDGPNTAELFQIWLNLPAAKKTAPPFFTIAWHEDQPKFQSGDGAELQLVGGNFLGLRSVPPPPDSYASDPASEIVIAKIAMKAGSSLTLPPASSRAINRVLYLYAGHNLTVDGRKIPSTNTMIRLHADSEVLLQAAMDADLVLLQGRPLNEPVVQHGPFVTSSRAQLEDVFARYQRTQFGGWKWGRSDPTHPRTDGRFYQMGATRVESPKKKEEL